MNGHTHAHTHTTRTHTHFHGIPVLIFIFTYTFSLGIGATAASGLPLFNGGKPRSESVGGNPLAKPPVGVRGREGDTGRGGSVISDDDR